MKGVTYTNRIAGLEEALRKEEFPLFRGRSVATITQLANTAGVPYSTIRNPYCFGKVRGYAAAGNGFFLDAEDLLQYFRTARRGRPFKKCGPSNESLIEEWL